MLRRSRRVSVGSSGRFAARASDDELDARDMDGRMTSGALLGGSSLMIVALMINDFRVRRAEGEEGKGADQSDRLTALAPTGTTPRVQ